MKYLSDDIRKKYLEFFETKNHKIIPSAPVVPDNDPTVLFNTAGMQPLVPYLLGETHPLGKRLADSQKCIRTGDIEEVGDDSHLTFFEMLGNWSLGDYFKEDSIKWSFEFLTSADWLALDPRKIAVTVFEGDKDAPRDEFSASVWESIGMPKDRISYLPKKDNWWAAGPTGPCGPDTEIFYWVGESEFPPEGSNVANDEKNWMEIWNNVFMEYYAKSEEISQLPQKNVDTGMGLERITATLNSVKSVYETDIFSEIIEKICEVLKVEYNEENKKSIRIIADHSRTASVIISDGVVPSNVDQGYVLRRLIRIAVRQAHKLGFSGEFLAQVADKVIDKLGAAYPHMIEKRDEIKAEISKEEKQFSQTLEKGLKEFDKLINPLIKGGQGGFKNYVKIPYREDLKEKSRELRKNMTGPEKNIWYQVLVKDSLEQIRFLRQKPLLDYIVDFYSPELNLVIEIDGDSHDLTEKYDIQRTKDLEKYGVQVIRFTNDECTKNIEGIYNILKQKISEIKEKQAKNPSAFQASPFEKGVIPGDKAFKLYDTYGFPLEMTKDLAAEKGLKVDEEGFQKSWEEHQAKSRAGAEKKFKGGLADTGEETIALHSATHLLLAGLRKYVGEHVHQKGSNITPERLRFDFNNDEKISGEVLKQVEDYVNEAISAGFTVKMEQMPKDEAKAQGVEGSFWEKYPDIVKVYNMVGSNGVVYSRELCGGPHVEDSSKMGKFKIKKEESSSAGIRRIKAVLEK